jgi:cephalosporin-C deacetylase-like acetyl esterase
MTRDQRPSDFDAYWSRVDEELARYPANAELIPSPRRTTDFAAAYDVRLTSLGPYRIFAYLSVPAGDGPFPSLLVTPRYGSVNHAPAWEDRQRYVTMVLMHRGQRLADEPFAANYPGLLTQGMDDPGTYVYRSIVADCLRAAEWLLARPEVDPSRVGVVGDDLALITAARRPLTAAQITGLVFYRLMEARLRTSAYPVEEVNDELRHNPGREPAVARTLAYFDPIHHARTVAAETLLVAGDEGAVGGSDWLAPLRDALGGPSEVYPVTHEGGTDHDWQDAWLARRLGVTPMPRLWTVEQ